jgi:hypothetical protein
MTGWVCRLQLLLALVSAVILRSESHGTHDHILLSQIRDSPNLEGEVPVFISPRNRVAQLYLQVWVPFSSPPTTRRDTIEVFEPASTRGCLTFHDGPCYIDFGRVTEKTPVPTVPLLLDAYILLYLEPLSSS